MVTSSRSNKIARRSLGALAIVSFCLLSSAGCVSLAANLLYAFKGDKVPAAFEGLEGKRVAVIVASDNGYSDPSAVMLGRLVRSQLQTNVKDVKLVSEDQVEDWLNQTEELDDSYIAIGRGVKADMVVAIEMTGLQVKDGDTLYRGRCDVTTTAYDVEKGNRPVFREHLHNFTFPSVGGQTITGTDESTFRKSYLQIVARRATRYFFPYDPNEDVAADAASLAF